MNNGASAGEFKQSMGERLRKSRERIDEIRAETQAKARRAVRITNNYAHDHPWRMVCTGVTLAFVAGYLMNSGKRPRRIVLKQPKPVIKVKAKAPSDEQIEKAVKKQSSFNLVQAFMPLALLVAKGMMAARQKNQIRPHPAENAPSGVPF
jgi:hypothetical protein